jgi:BTB/POZ domain-containing protein 9
MHELVGSLTQYLEYNIDEDNVCLIYATANLFNISSLINRCQLFLMHKGFKLLEQENFFTFSAKTIINLFSSDEFCAEEIDIFKAVIKYLKINPDCDEKNCEKLISTVRLPLICWNDLIAYVWPSGNYLMIN